MDNLLSFGYKDEKLVKICKNIQFISFIITYNPYKTSRFYLFWENK